MDVLADILTHALLEDIGQADYTTRSVVSPDKSGKMKLLVKEDGVIAGIELAQKLLKIHDKEIQISLFSADGDEVKTGQTAFEIQGKVWSMLSVERVLLNFMQRMSGIATYTRQLVKAVEGTGAKILDTRKTTPLLRLIEKEAVRAGGGFNHRFGLYDMLLIKDNHVDFAGGIIPAIEQANVYLQSNHLQLEIEIEVRNLQELQQVLQTGRVNRIMFDNFTPQLMREAVAMVNKCFETEASGNIRLENIRHYAETGVDFISVGALTHHVRSLDLSLKAIS